MSNDWKRYLVMNTGNSPAHVQQKVAKIAAQRPLIDLSTIEIEEDTTPTFEEVMKNGIQEN